MTPGHEGTLFDFAPDVERDVTRLTDLARELLDSAGARGVSVGDLRYSAENRGLLTGQESEARMNLLKLGKVMRDAGGLPNGNYRRSKVARAKRSLNAVYVRREFLPMEGAA